MDKEKELVTKSRDGDRLAFGQLYDLHVRRIYNFIYYKTLQKDVAEDLTSQTFFKVLKNIHTVDPEQSFVSWVYRIAQNTVIDHFRSLRPVADIDDIWDISDGTDIAKEAVNAEDAKHIERYLKKLSKLERDIIIMRVWQELPYKHIAEIVDKTETNCKVIYSRSMQKLRKLMPPAA
jgi:RNA polymerase sigma-70 factor (ECF subfamily)